MGLVVPAGIATVEPDGCLQNTPMTSLIEVSNSSKIQRSGNGQPLFSLELVKYQSFWCFNHTRMIIFWPFVRLVYHLHVICQTTLKYN
jgi:hypothetical protein